LEVRQRGSRRHHSIWPSRRHPNDSRFLPGYFAHRPQRSKK